MRAIALARAWVQGLKTWAAFGLAFGLGALATAAMAPAFMVFVLLPVFSTIFWLVHGRATTKNAFFTGLFFGLGFFIAGLYWVGFAFLTYPERFGAMAPFAVVGLASVLALYPACVFALVHWARPRTGQRARGVLFFAGLWVIGEWVRGWFLTGFPWNLLGTSLAFSDGLIQPAAFIGVYGLSLLVVLVATAPALLSFPGKGGIRFVGATLVLLVLVWAGGAIRLQGAGVETRPGVMLRLVQPNIEQKLKWRPSLRQAHVVRQVEMSRLPAQGAQSPTHVIWAETAVPFYLASDAERLQLVRRAVPPGGLLITGAPRIERTQNPTPNTPPIKVWNSLHAIDGAGHVVATYDKAHLVPFGEYMPLRLFLSRFFDVSKITAGSTDFSAGPGPTNLRLADLGRVSPLICYEGIFPAAVTAGAHKDDRPDWLLNITNDGWYGQTAGPYQHFQQVRLRAVEEGLPVVRVANTGISGVVDPYGRVTHQLPLGREGIIDAPLPLALAPTVFAKTGNTPAVLFACLMVLVGLLRRQTV